MFSTMPRIGTRQALEHRERLGDVATATTSWGVVTRTAPPSGTAWARVSWASDVPGRQVDDEVVELAPLDVAQELLDRAADERPAPDDRLALRNEELDRDALHAVPLERRDLVVRAGHRLALDAEHHRDVRAGDVGVEQADRRARLGERHGEVDADRALADAALAGRDRDDVLDARQELLRLLRVSPGGPSRPTSRRSCRPRSRARATLTLRSISSLSGQAGVVSSIVNATSAPSIAISLTMFRVTMSRPSSGSWTLRRASKMAPSVRAGIGSWTSAIADGISTASASISSSYSEIARDGRRVPSRCRSAASGLPERAIYEADPVARRANLARRSAVVVAHLGFLTPLTGDTYPRLADGDQGVPARPCRPRHARAAPRRRCPGSVGRAVRV